RLQDLVGPAQLAVLALQLHQALVLGGRHARPLAAVDLSAPDPLAQRLRRRDPQLRGDRGDRRPLRVVLAPVLPHHPDRPLAQLVRVLRRSAHRSILSQNGASTFPGAVQEGESDQEEQVVPTRVGVDRSRLEAYRDRCRRPHARGGGPCMTPYQGGTISSSPRAWGWTGTNG